MIRIVSKSTKMLQNHGEQGVTSHKMNFVVWILYVKIRDVFYSNKLTAFNLKTHNGMSA